MKGSIIEISNHTATHFLLPRHYAGRIPTITKAFGWYDKQTYTDDHLMAVCTFGKPSSPYVCSGICGEEYSKNVYELNRLCRLDEWDEPLSQFVSTCLRRLRVMNWIVVSYADTSMNHHGYVYQACNFIYTGCSKPRTDKFTGGKHARHYDMVNEDQMTLFDVKDEPTCVYRQVRSAKHRYIYFCTFNKRLKKEWQESLKYPVLEYPKGNNDPDYELGNFIKPVIITCENRG